MGNQTCCEDSRQQPESYDVQQQQQMMKQFKKNLQEVNKQFTLQKQKQEQKIENQQLPKQQEKLDPINQITIPPLKQEVIKCLQQNNFFQYELITDKKIIHSYGEDIYEGQINELTLKPNGFGKMYKKDGTLFIGQFLNGKAQGKGALIFPNGNYFKGAFKNNRANCENGQYFSEQLKYIGGFADNLFDGNGRQQRKNQSFQGKYSKGKKVQGVLKWKDSNQFQLTYSGNFNQRQQFHGYGKLIQDKGTYQGSFSKGLKDGKGIYNGLNGVKYEGQYKLGLKQGFGIIYNNDQTIAYKGQMKAGFPHGKGYTYIGDKAIEAQWVQGIDEVALRNSIKQ